MNSSYEKQLCDPRWKERRKQILKRDKHTCVTCGAIEQPQVHHIRYTGKAWEAPDADLVTLCNSCHKKLHHSVKAQPYWPKYFLAVKDLLVNKLLLWPKVLERATVLAQEASPTLNMILASVEFENLARVRPTLVAEKLGSSLPTVNRHFAKLRKLRLIEPDEVDKNRKQGVSNWRVHPLLAWASEAGKRERYLASLPEDHIFRSPNPYGENDA